jgi:hypothetical protein
MDEMLSKIVKSDNLHRLHLHSNQAAWQYFENRDNGTAFSKEEQSAWNDAKKSSK